MRSPRLRSISSTRRVLNEGIPRRDKRGAGRHDITLGFALVMGVLLAAGVAVPLSVAGGPTAEPQPVQIVALVNHSAADGALFLGQFCGGVIVAPRRVVTATHCLRDRPAQTVDVVAGVQDLCAPQSGRALRRARVVAVSALPHSAGTLSIVELDAAVSTPMEASQQVPAPDGVVALPGSPVTGWGWGRDAVSGVPSCALRPVQLSVVEPGRCARVADVTFDRAGENRAGPTSPKTGGIRAPYLCAVPDGAVNTCNGDSGGPVTAPDPISGLPRVIAITMSGSGCGPGSLGLSILLGGPLQGEAR